MGRYSAIFKIRAMRAATLFALALVLPAAAQVTTGSITGYVLDPANRPIAGAKVAASDSLRSTVREVVTDNKGLYYFADLPPATYTVDCSATNFATAAASVKVAVNANARVDFQLPIVARRETVTVEGIVHALESESGALGTVIEGIVHALESESGALGTVI